MLAKCWGTSFAHLPALQCALAMPLLLLARGCASQLPAELSLLALRALKLPCARGHALEASLLHASRLALLLCGAEIGRAHV